MKKVLAILLVCFAVATAVNAQDKAIGLKFGTYGAQISGQMAMGDANRIEANLSFLGGGLGLNGYYQWVNELPALGDAWKWYYGGGAGIWLGGGLGLGVGAQAGLEFDLQSVVPSLPLQLTFDVTPTINLIPAIGFGVSGGLGIRYRF